MKDDDTKVTYIAYIEPITIAETVVKSSEEHKAIQELEEEVLQFVEGNEYKEEEMEELDIVVFKKIGNILVSPEVKAAVKFKKVDKK